jgi:hypothetical protein
VPVQCFCSFNALLVQSWWGARAVSVQRGSSQCSVVAVSVQCYMTVGAVSTAPLLRVLKKT